MKNPDLLRALADCASVLQRAHRIAESAGHPYIAQLLRQASWKIGAAISTINHAAAESEAS